MTAQRQPFFGRAALVAATAVLSFVVFPTLTRAQAGRETDVEPILDRADALLQKGSYSQAIEVYLEASKNARLDNNLSRSYFGLSICYFYLRDMTNARLWLHRVLAVDPNREVSTLFYPADFVRLFQEVKSSSPGQSEDAKRAQPEVKPGTKIDVPAAAPQAPPAPVKPAKTGEERLPGRSTGKGFWEAIDGKFELEFHYGSWGINLAKGLFEESVTDGLANRLRDEVNHQVGRDDLFSSENTLGLDSEGHNYGFGLRVYPGGRDGSFSIGLSFEKTRIFLALRGPLKNTYVDSSYATVDADATVETSPWTTHMSFRWEFMPRRRISPFFNFGVGVGSFGGRVKYNFAGTYVLGTQDQHLEDSDDLDFEGVEQKWDVTIPDYVPFFHLGLGVRGEIIAGLTANLEAALWNGIVLRAGVAYRF